MICSLIDYNFLVMFISEASASVKKCNFLCNVCRSDRYTREKCEEFRAGVEKGPSAEESETNCR